MKINYRDKETLVSTRMALLLKELGRPVTISEAVEKTGSSAITIRALTNKGRFDGAFVLSGKNLLADVQTIRIADGKKHAIHDVIRIVQTAGRPLRNADIAAMAGIDASSCGRLASDAERLGFISRDVMNSQYDKPCYCARGMEGKLIYIKDESIKYTASRKKNYKKLQKSIKKNPIQDETVKIWPVPESALRSEWAGALVQLGGV